MHNKYSHGNSIPLKNVHLRLDTGDYVLFYNHAVIFPILFFNIYYDALKFSLNSKVVSFTFYFI